MRLLALHVADIHLGKNRKYPDYLEQQGFMLLAIVAQVKQALASDYDKVWLIVAGDVFDRNQNTQRSEFVLFLTHFLQPLTLLLASGKLDIFIIDGNHDRTPAPTEPSVLSSLVRMVPDRMNLAIIEPKFYQEHSMLAIPYNGLTGKQLRELISEHQPQFVIAHECLSRMTTDTGYTPPRDQDKYIEINEVLPGTSVVSMFLGDIHKSQTLDDHGISWYSGSPTTLDHGHRAPKGVLHHTFTKEGNTWVREASPSLVPLDDSRIKIHYQLGHILVIEDIPWNDCLQHETSYLDLVVSPEVYKAITEKIPSFFHNQQVSYTFHREIENTKQAANKEESSINEQDIDMTYYDKAIAEWASINLPHLAEDVKSVFIERVSKLFVGRG